jgi:hypothetical protein
LRLGRCSSSGRVPAWLTHELFCGTENQTQTAAFYTPILSLLVCVCVCVVVGFEFRISHFMARILLLGPHPHPTRLGLLLCPRQTLSMIIHIAGITGMASHTQPCDMSLKL